MIVRPTGKLGLPQRSFRLLNSEIGNDHKNMSEIKATENGLFSSP